MEALPHHRQNRFPVELANISSRAGGDDFQNLEEQIGNAMRHDAEPFAGTEEVTQETFILLHGRVSERVRKTAFEVLVHCRPIGPA